MTIEQVRATAKEIFNNSGVSKKDAGISVVGAGSEIVVKVIAKTDANILELYAKMVEKLEMVDKCKASGEILSGGNIMVLRYNF